MSGKHRLSNAISRLDLQKVNKSYILPGVLGITMNGSQVVEVPNRAGYVYVRLRDNQSELFQAYNDVVSPVYDLPVLIVRDDIDTTKYRVIERDLGRYQQWGSSFVPRHGNQHSFSGDAGGGGDPVWVYGRQFMPLMPHPSGTRGSNNIVIEPYTYYWNADWRYAGGTGTASFLPYKPTGSSARMVLIYLDENTNPTLLAGSTYFNAALTGSNEILPYVPDLPTTSGIPVGAVRLVSGTSIIGWDNIYDLRPFIVGDSFIPTGSSGGHVIQDEGVNRTPRHNLNFTGPNLWAIDDSVNNATKVIISGSSYPIPVAQPMSVSDPPTDNEIASIFGEAYNLNDGFLGMIINSWYPVSGTWLVAVAGGYWEYLKMNLAL